MFNVMIDLETLGTNPGCSVLSIGAVVFTDRNIGDGGFYEVIGRDSCKIAGLFEEQTTLDWWTSQSTEARGVMAQAENADSLSAVLDNFDKWLQPYDPGSVLVWGNGADFDQPILTAAYRAVSKRAPWKFYNNRCYRTLKNLYPMIQIKRAGVHHNAFDDARSQADHAVKIFERHLKIQDYGDRSQ